MKIYSERNLRDFEFWGGAKDHAALLSYEQFNQVEDILNAIFPEGMSDTQINDLFWFDSDFIYQRLGYDDYEDFLNKRNQEGGGTYENNN